HAVVIGRSLGEPRERQAALGAIPFERFWFATHGRLRRERRIGAVLDMAFRGLIVRVDEPFEVRLDGGYGSGRGRGEARWGGFGFKRHRVAARPHFFTWVAHRHTDRVFRARF